MSDNRRNNLDKALGQFIEAMRSFVVIEMGKEYGDNWGKEYYNGLTDFQKESWEIAINQGKTAKDLIDFHNLKGFALNQKQLLRKFFGRDTNIYQLNLVKLQMLDICLHIMVTGMMILLKLLS